MNATEIVIYIFRKTLVTLLDTFDIGGGVTIGWVIIGVGLIGMLISTILSRPISGRIDREIIAEKQREYRQLQRDYLTAKARDEG